MRKKEKWIKLACTVLCEIFTVCTIIMLFADGETSRLALSFATILLAAEFCKPDFVIYMITPEGYETRTLAQLLPDSFSL